MSNALVWVSFLDCREGKAARGRGVKSWGSPTNGIGQFYTGHLNLKKSLAKRAAAKKAKPRPSRLPFAGKDSA